MMGASNSVKISSRLPNFPELPSARSNLPNSNNRLQIRSDRRARDRSEARIHDLHYFLLLAPHTGTLGEVRSCPVMVCPDQGHNALQLSLQRRFDRFGLALSACYTAHVGGIHLQLPSDAAIKASDQRSQVCGSRHVYTFCAGHVAP